MAGQIPPPWTPAQWEAITRGGGTVLVSAAAGSGKTAVLVERIIRKLTAPDNPVDVDRLLVVTFTEAAATQMRQRIAAALQEQLDQQPRNDRLKRQLALLPKASISTLHAFCHGVLRQYFFRAGLDPRFRIADEHEAVLLQHDALDTVLAGAYDRARAGDPFSRLALAASGPDSDEPLRRLIMSLYEQARSLPNPIGWLQQLPALPDVPTAFGAGPFLDESPWSADLRRWVRLRLHTARDLLQQARELAAGPGGVLRYLSVLDEQVEQVEALDALTAKPWDELREGFLSLPFPALPRARPGEGDKEVRSRVQSLRNEASKLLMQVRDMLFLPSPERHGEELAQSRPYLQCLVDLTLAFAREYDRLKASRSVLDFADLEHRCLELLVEGRSGESGPDSPANLRPSPVARELRERFMEVLVDEYQDTNPLQDTILQLVSGEHRGERSEGRNRERTSGEPRGSHARLFVVGDVKQSIYRFRLADPTLFLRRYARSRALTPGEDPPAGEAAELRIDLNANFRSRRPVVEAVNYIFRRIMVPEVGEMAYDRGAELVYRADYPPLPAPSSSPDGEAGEKAGNGAAAAEEPESPWESGDTPEDGDPPVEFHLVERSREGGEDDPEDLSAFEREAVLVARRIRELAGMGDDNAPPAMVWDRDGKRYRPLRLGDITVLLRATKDKANALVEILGRCGIPAYAELGSGYFAATEVETMLALLSVIDNPRQDIPLAAVLRSPIVGMSAEDLARIRLMGDQAGARDSFYDALVAAAGGAPAGSGSPETGSGGSDADGPEGIGSMVEDRSGDPLARRCRAFLRRLDGWRTAARRGPLGDLVQTLYRDTRYDQYVGALPGSRQRLANLRTLYERARQFDQFHRYGLARFLRFIRRLQETEGDLGAAPAAAENPHAVRVMSVHRSKGLEFPVAILMDVGREFRSPRGEAGLFLFHRELGAGMKTIDERQWGSYPSLPYLAIQERIRQEEMAEEMRILYVALTRARERLIIVGSAGNLARTCAAWLAGSDPAVLPDGPDPLPAARLAAAKSWLDWLGPALIRHPAGEPLRLAAGGAAPMESGDRRAEIMARNSPDWRIILWRTAGAFSLEPPPEAAPPPIGWERIAAGEPLEREPIGPVPESLDRRLAWRYPWRELTAKAAKVGISELKGRWGAEEDEETQPLTWPVAAPFSRRPRVRETAPRGLTPAERGIAVHRVLQLLDLGKELDEGEIERQVARLRGEGRLTEEQAAAVDCRKLAAFFASSLGRRIREAADRVQREVPFTLALPAGEVYPDLPREAAEGEYVLTQGIMDVMIPLEEGVIIVDFKTDRVGPGAAPSAARRYGTQMKLYRRAAEEIFGRPVAEIHIVFLETGEAVRVH